MQRQAQQHHNHHDDYKGQKEQKHIFPKRNVENKDRDSEHFKIAKNGYKQSAEGIGQTRLNKLIGESSIRLKIPLCLSVTY